MAKKKNVGAFAAMAAAVFCACNVWAYSGKNKVTNDWTNVDLGMGGSTPACIWQPEFTVTSYTKDSIWGVANPPVAAAYLLDGGSLKFNGNGYIKAPYLQFRQRGGTYTGPGSGFRVEDSYHTEYSLRGDFVYSGDAVANTEGFGKFSMAHYISVSDNATVECGWINEDKGKWTNENIIAINGGRINVNTYGRTSRCVYFYNGGELYTSYGDNSAAYGVDSYTNAVVRVCERGGSFRIASRTTALAAFREPIGNVVKSVTLTDAVREMVWPMPPAVVITGSGSNAFAVADWDYDTGRVTNITVLCCGEGYTDDGTTKANFAYKKGDSLLETPLDCILGIERANGDFTFAMESGSGDTSYFRAYTTNEWRGATIIDTDRKRTITHDAALTTSDYGHSLATYSSSYFPYTTNIIIKSGELIDASNTSINPKFPSCTRFEAYSGHLARSTHRFKDVVIGGELWLCCINKSHGYTSVLNVTNTLWVAPGASVTNGVVVTPKVKYGTFTINNDAKVAIQDWSKLPKGKKIVALDLSEVGTLNRKSGGPVLERSDEGILEWNDTEKKLYARRHADGMFLIFR